MFSTEFFAKDAVTIEGDIYFKKMKFIILSPFLCNKAREVDIKGVAMKGAGIVYYNERETSLPLIPSYISSCPVLIKEIWEAPSLTLSGLGSGMTL